MKQSLTVKVLAIVVLTWFVAALPAGAQLLFEILSLDGSAKIQGATKKHFEVLNQKMRVGDNDIIETFFKTRCVMQFGQGNIIVLGSNSKALFNITTGSGPDGPRLEASFTLFGGGILVKSVSSSHISVYTANGVCELDQGSVSTIVDPKTGETGFQILGGDKIDIRNIAQQKGRLLTAGQTTMVLPGREPTAALFLTYKHVRVLKHFFGDEYIQNELDEAGITPTEETVTPTRKMQLSQNIMLEKEQSTPSDFGMYKQLFTLEGQLTKQFTADEEAWPLYHPIGQTGSLYDKKLELGGRAYFSIVPQGMFPLIEITPRFSASVVDAGLRLKLVRNYESFGLKSFSSGLPGILDVVDHVNIVLRDSLYVFKLGPLVDYTIGDGFMVNRLNNRNAYSLLQPLGLTARVDLFREATLNLFVGDVSDFSWWGAHVLWETGQFYLGLGYYMDADQNSPLKSKSENRFVETPLPGGSTRREPVQIVEVDLGSDMVYSDRGIARMMVEYAQKLFNGYEGFVVRAPNLEINVRRMEFGGSVTLENGRMFANEFSWFYPSNRVRINDTSKTSTPAVITETQNGKFERKRRALGLRGIYRINPIKGMALELEVKHDLASDLMYLDSAGNDSLVRTDMDFDFYFAASINDSLFEMIKYAKLFVEQTHGGLFPLVTRQNPTKSGYNGNYGTSWGFRAGLYLLTAPLVNNIAVELGVNYYYLDMDKNFDGILGPDDSVVEVYGGLKWGVF